jgi:GrpB-like predicted nucleotidyltransferase (UPF0157 family)
MEKLPALLLIPFMLVPAIVAVSRGKRSRVLICVLNVILVPFAPWLVGLLLSVYPSVEIATTRGLLSIATLVAVWLALLHAAVSKDSPAAEELDEPVELVDHDASWAQAFAAEHARLVGVLAIAPDTLEHIGSTAVPGLPAKPVIDLMLGVTRLDRTLELVSRLQILGYQNMGEAGVPGRVNLRQRGDRDFNLHIVELGGRHWVDNLALRELLRTDVQARDRYAAAKKEALAAGATRLLAYSSAKQPVLAELLARAR